ncbi:MAG: hypothetical protein Q6363_009810 [Candidatus Njordarchaeota archaeon]
MRIHKKERFRRRYIVVEKLHDATWKGWHVLPADGKIIDSTLFRRFEDAKRSAIKKVREKKKAFYILKIESAYVVDIMTEKEIEELFEK